MKRHPSLEPFSRDHNDGLILARKLSTAGAEALPEFRHAWEVELADHFREEERLLGPLCDEVARTRLFSEHEDIETLGKSATDDGGAGRLGELLNDHIRWEERELFVAIEKSADPATLQSLGVAAQPLEKRRWKIDSNRAELVARRLKPDEVDMADLAYLTQVSQSNGPQWGAESEDLNATLLTWRKGQGIDAHVNEEVDVLIVCIEGELIVTIDGLASALRKGHVVIVPKGASRSLAAVSDGASHLNVHRRKRKLIPSLGGKRS